jgi:hypothetical protein
MGRLGSKTLLITQKIIIGLIKKIIPSHNGTDVEAM